VSTYVHDSDAVLPYEWDWSEWLANEGADTLTMVGVTVVGSPADILTIGAPTQPEPGVVRAMIGPAVDDECRDAQITCHIETAGGRKDDRTIAIKIRNR